MKKFKSRAGLVVYKVSAKEMAIIDSPGICDFCGKKPNSGFLVAVMNKWMCPECYKDWDEASKYYPEDAHIEKRNEEYYDHVFLLFLLTEQKGGPHGQTKN